MPEDICPTSPSTCKSGTLEVEAYSRDDTTKLATGKLLTIDNQIDQTTGTGKLKAMFDNSDNALWPNQFVNVRLLLETKKGATVIPAAAIQRGPQGATFVYVVKPDKTVEVRPHGLAHSGKRERHRHRSRSRASRSLPTDRTNCKAAAKLSRMSANSSPARATPRQTVRNRRAMSPSRLFILRPVATTLLMVGSCWWASLPTGNFRFPRLPEVDYPTIQV